MFYNQQVAKFTRAHWPDWSPAFIYQRYSLGNYAGVLLRAHYGVPLICEYNGSLVWMMRHWTRKKLCYEKLNTQIELLNLHAADVVVVNSQPMADELGVRGLRDLDKVLVNPNGVDPDRYSPTVDGSAVRQRYGLQDVLLIGFIGSFGPWHGVDVLIQAFGQLMRTNPGDRAKVRLMLIGDGPEMPSVRARIAELGIGGECILIGAVPQEKGPAYLAACDILASPHVPNLDGSRFFGSPTKLFEYMAMGKGIVASDLEQIGEILKHDQTAWLVRPGDVGDLMAGLKRLLDDNACRHRLGAAARREVTARYTWQEHTRRIMSKLDERAR
jgi:glycosyltransferase involved in cell wall biosynthesis